MPRVFSAMLGSGACARSAGAAAIAAHTTAGGFVVKPAGTVHANRFGPAGARMASIGLRPGFRPWEHGRVRGLEGWRWMDGGAAPRALWRLLRTAGCEPGRGAALLADGFWEVMDAL